MSQRHNRSQEVRKEGGYIPPFHRDVSALHPEIDADKLEELTGENPRDVLGSYSTNRAGPLRGAPEATWVSLDPKLHIFTVSLSSESTVYIQAYNCYYTTNIYISAENSNMFEVAPKEYDPFSSYENRLATECPSFTAIAVPEWTITNNTNMYFTLSAPLTTGCIDIILQGPAGYTRTSTSVYTDSQSATRFICAVGQVSSAEVSSVSSAEVSGLSGGIILKSDAGFAL